MTLELDVILEASAPTPTFHPGERIRGEVRVKTTEAGRCELLEASLLWHTHGTGNKQERVVQNVPLFTGEWTAAGKHSYPFELEVPAGPFSYAGTLVHVDWAVQARAHVPWASDPKLRYRVLVRPWDAASLPAKAGGSYRQAGTDLNDEFETGDPIPTPAQAARSRSREMGCLVGCGSLLTLVGALGVMVLINEGIKEAQELLLALPFGVLMLVSALLRRWSARRLGGAPTVSLEPEIVEAGESLTVTVSFTVPTATELELARATFHGQEVATSGSGKNSTTQRQPLHEELVELAAPGTRLEAGVPRELRARFELPAEAPYSFSADSNKIYWSVDLVVNPKGAPAWSRSVPVTVRPRRIERLRDGDAAATFE